MFRKLIISMVTLGALGGAAALPASAQPVWGSISTGFRIGHTPVQLAVGTAPAPAYVEPAPVVVEQPVYPAPAYVVVNGYAPPVYDYYYRNGHRYAVRREIRRELRHDHR